MATALVVGNMIGSGVFLLPSSLAKYGGISIVAWLLTAAGAMLLALVFARLGRVPWRSSALELIDRVGGMDGVVEVVDRLSWRHDDTVRVATTPWG